MAQFQGTVYRIQKGQLLIDIPGGSAKEFPDTSIIRVDSLTAFPSVQSAIHYTENGIEHIAYCSETAAALIVLANASSGGGGGGDASAANQVTGNTSLSSIDSKTPALGQALAASSQPVVLPAAQITALTPPAAITGFALETGGNLALAATNAVDIYITGQAAQSAANNNIILAVAGSGSTDTFGASASFRSFSIQINGSSGVASGAVTFEGSNDNTNFVPLTVYDDAIQAVSPINTAITIGASTFRFFSGKTTYRYVRCRISTVFTGGTVQAFTRLSTTDYILRSELIGQNAAANSVSVALPNEQVQDLYITGAAAQSASGNNILLAAAGSGSLDSMQPQSFRSFYVQVNGSAGITTGQIIFEGSNDNTFTSAVTLSVVDEITVTGVITQAAQNIAASTQRYFAGKISTRYIRCRISTVFAGGTVQAFTRLSTQDYVSRVFPVIQTNQANLSISIGGVAGTTVVNGGLAGTLAVGGAAAHSAATTTNPVTIGGKVVSTTAPDTTLVTGDASHFPMSSGSQAIMKLFGTAELDFTCHGTFTNSITAVNFKNAAGASLRNYITALTYSSDALATATELWIEDGAITFSSQTIAGNTLTSAANHDLKIGDSVNFTASGVTGISTGTVYYVLTVASATTLTLSATPNGSVLAISGTSVTATAQRILFRTKLQTGATDPVQITFPTPLRGTPNTITDVRGITTSATGNIYYLVQGYVGF